MITTTLKRIRKHRPCQNGWRKLLKGLGKKKADGEPLSFATILEIIGIHDALWCCRVEPQYAKEWRLLSGAFARRVEHLNIDSWLKNIIDFAERYANGEATDEELRVAAGVAAFDAARGAAGVAGAAKGIAVWDAAAFDAERKWQTQEFLRVVTETE
jgi:hypothetical protein